MDTQPPVEGPGPKGSALLPVFWYASTIFLGSFLLFILEPLYAKLILPRFGGSASVWILCLVFYQCALLLGYAYADWATRSLKPRQQTFLHLGLLLASLAFMPIGLTRSFLPQPGADMAWLILGLLTVKIGLPFVLLSSTSPLIQSWYSRSRSQTNPYLLFALSNGASLLALILFPALIEPRLPSSFQAAGWSGLYLLFVLLCSSAAWGSRQASPLSDLSEVSPIPWKNRLVWMVLAACGSMLLLSVTNQITQNVAPVPLLWVIPLAVYLLTFILVFSGRGFYPRRWILYLLPVALVLLIRDFYVSSSTPTLLMTVLVFCGGLFIACFFCHGELANRRPPATQLTAYYLMVSLGGALGAIFVGLASPLIFPNIYEFPIALILTGVIAFFLLWEKGIGARIFWGLVNLLLAFVLFNNIQLLNNTSVIQVRDFYAPLRVTLQQMGNAGKFLTLINGTIVHGREFIDPARAMEPTAYYSRSSGIGLVLREASPEPRRVGVIGMGIGTLAAYGKPGDLYRFYEINPQVPVLASQYFHFLSGSRAKVEVVPGDARLSLEAEAPQDYDVLAVDAFSGDAIPVHLLTKEAFELYFRHLKPNGILAVHTTNLYLNLLPVVRLLAESFGYPAVCVRSFKNNESLAMDSDWMLVTKDQALLDRPEVKAEEIPVSIPPGLRLWTDDDNSLFPTLK